MPSCRLLEGNKDKIRFSWNGTDDMRVDSSSAARLPIFQFNFGFRGIRLQTPVLARPLTDDEIERERRKKYVRDMNVTREREMLFRSFTSSPRGRHAAYIKVLSRL